MPERFKRVGMLLIPTPPEPEPVPERLGPSLPGFRCVTSPAIEEGAFYVVSGTSVVRGQMREDGSCTIEKLPEVVNVSHGDRVVTTCSCGKEHTADREPEQLGVRVRCTGCGLDVLYIWPDLKDLR